MLVLLAQNYLIIQMAISNAFDSDSTSAQSPFPSAHVSMIRRLTKLLTVWTLVLVMLLFFAACGPEKSGESQEQLLAATQKIALDYQTNGNLEQARSEVSALKVANPNQWLIYVAETVIAENNDQASMTALAHLTGDLGLQSEPISQFAIQHNLLKSAAAVVAGTTQKATPNAPTPNIKSVQVQLALTPTLSSAIIQPTSAPVALITSTIATTDQPTTSNLVSTSLILVPTPILQETTAAAESVATKPVATKPMVKASGQANMRSGPGTAYTIAGALQTGDSAEIIGKNENGDWWEIALNNGQQGWVFGQLMETSGDVTKVAVAADIPPPPPTDTPAPVPPTDVPATPVPPAADTPAAPTPIPNGNEFVMVQRHLWDVIENGGQLDGPSVTCGQARELIVNVLDANGNRLNGVAVQVQYGAKEIYVTGAQGKGDGVAEFVLGGGQDVKVVKDVDGRDVTSDLATGLTTKPWDIPFPTLIEGRFCQDDASCKNFVDHTGCYGHYSWTVTFKRQH